LSEQIVNKYKGRVYKLRYFYDTPVLNPSEFMAGQRIWRPFVLEERVVFDKHYSNNVINMLIQEDHSFTYIHSIANTTLHVCYNKHTRKLND
jgi:hypothetical protein